jgi:flavorubredoxin
MAYAAVLANALKPNVKYATIIGSYGWGSKAVETIAGLIPNLKVEIIPSVLCKGQPREADYQALEKLAETIVQKHKESGFK